MNRKTFSPCRLAMAIIALGLSAHAWAGASERSEPVPCDNASLKGDYGFHARGTTLVGVPLPPALLGSFASAGVSHFDGRGNFSLSATASFNGVIQAAATRGTYQVNPDCTYTSTAENGTSFRSVIVDGGREILILQTDPSTVIAGTARQQNPRPRRYEADWRRKSACSARTIRGTYGFLAEGMAGPPTVPAAGPLDGVGTVSFDSGGEFLLIATRSVNGVLDPAPLPLKGTYAIGADCSLNMNFEVGFTFKAAVSDGGEQIDFVETDAGTSLLVKAKRL